MSIETAQLYTVQCDCCKKNYEGEDFAFWHEFDDARQYALDEGWIEKEAESEHDDELHFCPDCFTIDDDDMVTTKNGIQFQN